MNQKIHLQPMNRVLLHEYYKGFVMDADMNAAEAAEAFFREYNQKNAEHMMTAPEGVGYCLAVKK